MAKNIGVLIRKNKHGNTFYCRLWYPPTQNSRNITLGKETEQFTDIEALQRLNILKDHFKNKNYNYKLILKQLGEEETPETDLTLNEVAKRYFDKKYESIRSEFFNNYKNRFEFTDIEQIDDNPVFKKKIKHFRTFRNYYKNHVEVKEWEYIQEFTKRDKKPKLKPTKVGIKERTKLGLTNIKDISKNDIETWMKTIQNKADLEQKTKHNLIAQLKTIFNFAVNEEYLEKSPFDRIKKEDFTKNPHNYRERLLDIDEMNYLLSEFKKLKNQNSFNASLIGLSLGCRVNSALNILKSDFKLDEKAFNDYYSEVKIINFKTQNVYTLPIVKEVGRYFYYLLKEDWELDEYILRPMTEDRRLNKPMVELPKDFRETTDRTVNADEKVKSLYEEVEENLDKIKDFTERHKDNKNASFYIERWNNRTIELKDEIKQAKKEYLKNKEKYLKNNFSFHNFRHQLVSLTSIYNPLYAKRILNHSSDRKNATTDRYIKSDMDKTREILEKALKQYVAFLKPINKELSSKYDYNKLKEEWEYNNNVKPLAEAFYERKDIWDLDKDILDFLLSHKKYKDLDFSKLTSTQIYSMEQEAKMEYLGEEPISEEELNYQD